MYLGLIDTTSVYKPWSLLPYINVHFGYVKSVAWTTHKRALLGYVKFSVSSVLEF